MIASFCSMLFMLSQGSRWFVAMKIYTTSVLPSVLEVYTLYVYGCKIHYDQRKWEFIL